MAKRSYRFQSTLSVRRATVQEATTARAEAISIHALRKESDLERQPRSASANRFQSTLSVRRATQSATDAANAAQFQSTLSVRRATVRARYPPSCAGFQSTLSVRRATRAGGSGMAAHDISIHALRKESDLRLAGSFLRFEQFQSTLSVRRATTCAMDDSPEIHISIHALRKESDPDS